MTAAEAAHGASGVPAALLFFALPIALLGAAVGLRGSGTVESRTSIMSRMRPLLADAARAADTEGVPRALLLAVAASESAGRADARSRKGAVGLMQLMPATAEELARRAGEPAADLHDPRVSLRLGARYLAAQLRRFRESPHADELALCAYNAGPSRVAGWLRDGPPPRGSPTLGAWIPYPETRAYVRRVTAWRGLFTEALAARDAGRTN